MLGFVGFICAALVIAFFAATSYRAFLTIEQNKRWAFGVAFGLLAVNMLIWAVCCLLQPAQVEHFMLLSDVILLTATGLIGSILAGRYITLATVLYPFIAGALLVRRAYDFAPQATVKDGLLYFNLQPSVKAVIIGLLLFVWLPATMYIVQKGLRHQLLARLRSGVILLFATMIFATAILVSARQSAVLILSFVSIIGLFAAAVIVNLAVARIYEKEGGAHAAKRSRK